jgi:hypothetical protein
LVARDLQPDEHVNCADYSPTSRFYDSNALYPTVSEIFSVVPSTTTVTCRHSFDAFPSCPDNHCTKSWLGEIHIP